MFAILSAHKLRVARVIPALRAVLVASSTLMAGACAENGMLLSSLAEPNASTGITTASTNDKSGKAINDFLSQALRSNWIALTKIVPDGTQSVADALIELSHVRSLQLDVEIRLSHQHDLQQLRGIRLEV